VTADQKIILDFLRNQPMAVISTLQPGSLQPESALIAFAETDRLEIIFESFVTARKWHNLQKNPHVSLVMGWDTDRHITVQYEGRAAALPPRHIERYIQLFLAKDTPCSETFLRDPRVRLFKVTPTWIRYSDYTGDTPRIIEIDY